MLDLLTLPVICIPRQSRSYSFNRNDVELIGFKFLVLPTALIRVKIWTFVKIEIYGLSMTAEHTDLALIGGACQLTLSQVLTGQALVIRSSSSIVDSFYLLTSTLHSHWCHHLVPIPDWFRNIYYLQWSGHFAPASWLYLPDPLLSNWKSKCCLVRVYSPGGLTTSHYIWHESWPRPLMGTLFVIHWKQIRIASTINQTYHHSPGKENPEKLHLSVLV